MDDEEEFFDAVSGLASGHSPDGLSEAPPRVPGVIPVDPSRSNGMGKAGAPAPRENGLQKRRTALPAPMFTRSDFSMWSVLRKCIGLVRGAALQPGVGCPGPVSWAFKGCLRTPPFPKRGWGPRPAGAAPPACEGCSPSLRSGSFCCPREDLGFRFISEQVSHHPPVSAFYSEGLNQDFLLHGSIYPKLKFWGKSVEAEPRGTITLELRRHGEAYTWTNPTCCVHNVIVGKLWIEQYGTVQIVNHRTGDKCVLHFRPCGLFGKELHRVDGHIQDRSRKKLFVVYGKWTECLWGIDAAAYESFHRQERRGELPKRAKQDGGSREAQGAVTDAPPEAQDTVQVIPGSKLLWRVNTRPPNSAQMYNFTSFAVSLNELETSMEKTLAPTDCRLRPDIRGMENGDMDLASQEKERLEEKQREARRERAKEDAEWQTRWFRPGSNPYTGAPDWLYAGGYFERDFSGCPDIY
ncbi:PREDICTED: oxysterol-binding protein-related protein 2 [Condylura cristata]|uniref:oxysterol-binding protein-related protein 2 n=1 Tax=Condylura cristata TaxID=143302 RepID=UPI000642B188|nr:PREDICTED: oxysterol-binding protein-related protein 2 [Condylura cristata]